MMRMVMMTTTMTMVVVMMTVMRCTKMLLQLLFGSDRPFVPRSRTAMALHRAFACIGSSLPSATRFSLGG